MLVIVGSQILEHYFERDEGIGFKLVSGCWRLREQLNNVMSGNTRKDEKLSGIIR